MCQKFFVNGAVVVELIVKDIVTFFWARGGGTVYNVLSGTLNPTVPYHIECHDANVHLNVAESTSATTLFPFLY